MDRAESLNQPRFEFAFELQLQFTRIQTVGDMPTGAARGAVYVDGGRFEGPRLRGRCVPNSGGDYSLFRPDDVLSFDARYMLEEDDGTLILLHNRGYLWGRQPDTMAKIRAQIFSGGPPISADEYYLRANPVFDVPKGKHDWLMKHVFVGLGERLPDGNRIRYFAVL
jgi:hypothetical protein